MLVKWAVLAYQNPKGSSEADIAAMLKCSSLRREPPELPFLFAEVKILGFRVR